MRNLITHLLIALATVLHGQQDTTDHWLPAFNNQPIVEGEINIKSGPGDMIHTSDKAFWMFSGLNASETITTLVYLLDQYEATLPYVERHETDLNREMFLSNCDLDQVEHKAGFEVWYEWKCNNPNHLIRERRKPTFIGFTNWLRSQQ